MPSPTAAHVTPSIRGAALNVLRVELSRLLAQGRIGPSDISDEVAALLATPVSQSEWQPVSRWHPLIRTVVQALSKDRTGTALRECGVRIADSLFAGRYTAEEVRRTRWPAPVGSLMVELARAVFNFGRWEFEMVKFPHEGIVHAHDAEAFSDEGRIIIENVVAALAARAFGAEVRTASARTDGHVTFRLRRRGISVPPGSETAGSHDGVPNEPPFGE